MVIESLHVISTARTLPIVNVFLMWVRNHAGEVFLNLEEN